MTIEHVAACDTCGENGLAIFEGPEDWVPPATWITIAGLMLEARHFCSWPCVGRYVTQKIREIDLEPPLEGL